MRVTQGEPCLAVVEASARPGGRLVTVGARGAKLAAVRVVGLVAVDAAGRSLAKFPARFVAGVAASRRMRAGQREVGLGMVERRPGEPDDVRVAALVLGVAGLALRRVDIGQAAVKTSVRADVGRDVLVAGHAKRALAAAVGAIVAL